MNVDSNNVLKTNQTRVCEPSEEIRRSLPFLGGQVLIPITEYSIDIDLRIYFENFILKYFYQNLTAFCGCWKRQALYRFRRYTVIHSAVHCVCINYIIKIFFIYFCFISSWISASVLPLYS